MRAPALAGRTALVTGSTRGIGRAIAEALVRAGARVAVSSRDGDAGYTCQANMEGAVRSGRRAAGQVRASL